MSDGGGEVHNIPFDIIIRPLPPYYKQEKVDSIAETLQTDPSKVPPITVLWVQGKNKENFYYSFGGCHRYHAYQKLNTKVVPAIIQRITVDELKTFIGNDLPMALRD